MSKQNRIALSHIVMQCVAADKKQLLQKLAQLAAASTGVAEHVIFEALFAREKLGTTAIGQGIAIPHSKIAGLDSVYGFFVKLNPALDFAARDDRPVDLVFLLLAPQDGGADHLKALAKISRMFHDPAFSTRLRAAPDAKAALALLAGWKTEADLYQRP